MLIRNYLYCHSSLSWKEVIFLLKSSLALYCLWDKGQTLRHYLKSFIRSILFQSYLLRRIFLFIFSVSFLSRSWSFKAMGYVDPFYLPFHRWLTCGPPTPKVQRQGILRSHCALLVLPVSTYYVLGAWPCSGRTAWAKAVSCWQAHVWPIFGSACTWQAVVQCLLWFSFPY